MVRRKKRALILCTGNSCRSQMAEAWWRLLGRPHWECHSAGSRPAGFVHPEALAVLAEAGVPHPAATSKSLEEFIEQPFDLVVTVCDGANEVCPVFPGAARREHWPFDDPATATGTEAQVRAEFRRVRDEIRARVESFLHEDASQPGEVIDRWLRQALDLAPARVAPERRAEYEELLRRTCVLAESGEFRWSWVPGEIHSIFGHRGWAWNGIYALREESTLRLVASAGPPVCNTLVRRGGVGSSGMCFDGILMNQTLVAAPVSAWPGYVSCDSESGIATAAGMVSPIRDAHGTPIAVWDLDSTESLNPSDPFFFDRYFATLSAVLKPTVEDLA